MLERVVLSLKYALLLHNFLKIIDRFLTFDDLHVQVLRIIEFLHIHWLLIVEKNRPCILMKSKPISAL